MSSGESSAERLLSWLGLALGLGAGNHVTLLLLVPAVIPILWHRSGRMSLGWKAIAKACLAFGAGLSVYIYLPVRAIAAPTPNWGDPSTLDGFVWMVSGTAYRHYVFGLPLGYLPARLSAWASELVRQYYIWGVALGFYGLWQEIQRDDRRALSVGLVFLLYSVYAIAYNTTDSYIYLIPAYMVFALWVGRGIFAVLGAARRLGPRWPIAPPVVTAAIIALPFVSVALNYGPLDVSREGNAAEYGAKAMRALRPDSIVISASDGHTFALWYASEVSQPRPDVAVIDQDLLQYPWYLSHLRDRYPYLDLPKDLAPAMLRETILENRSDESPVYLADPNEDDYARYGLVPEGQLYLVH